MSMGCCGMVVSCRSLFQTPRTWIDQPLSADNKCLIFILSYLQAYTSHSPPCLTLASFYYALKYLF